MFRITSVFHFFYREVIEEKKTRVLVHKKVFQTWDAESPGVVTAFPLHALLLFFRESLDKLNVQVPGLLIEKMSYGIHEAMSAPKRRYHVTQHALEMALMLQSDPLAVLAALFHDVVYLQVDEVLPAGFQAYFEDLQIQDKKLTLPQSLHGFSADAWEDLLGIFGFQIGQTVDFTQGLNELLSALIAWRSLDNLLPRDALRAIAVCIEITIAFRHTDKAPLLPVLHARLQKLQFKDIPSLLKRAQLVSTCDLSNFFSQDPGYFLSQSWNLLMEGNAVFQKPLYLIRDYRAALQKMLLFFNFLTPERIILTDGDQDSELRWWVERNLDIGRIYLKAKLLAVGYVEALALETGGQAPLALFLGEVPLMGPALFSLGNRERVFSHLRPHLVGKNLSVLHLLQFGRTGHKYASGRNFFDYDHSPLADVLYACLPHKLYTELTAEAELFFEGKLTAASFLSLFPEPLNGILRKSLTECAVTRV